MNEEITTSELRITMDKPEKNPKRVAAGKNLVECNKAMKSKKESGQLN